jgi:hypothetical protein
MKFDNTAKNRTIPRMTGTVGASNAAVSHYLQDGSREIVYQNDLDHDAGSWLCDVDTEQTHISFDHTLNNAYSQQKR